MSAPDSAPAEGGGPPPPDGFRVVRCRDCKHWDRRWPTSNHAECMLAKRYSLAGITLITTDLGTCSQGEAR
jgi:hypothetical protein